ncbi:MAG TPA: tetratricopeptide repeat protein [Tepidisphaeraceae bacterium]|nr:tetratricopeptide repeat protein [Tepidisphaeraceae bacterium]
MDQTALMQMIGRARQLMAGGQRGEAERLCREVLAAWPDCVPALELLGMLAAREGRLTEALGAYERLTALRPDYAEGQATLGSMLTVAGRFEEAAQRFREALRFRPQMVDVYYHLGNALGRAGRDGEAEEALRTAARLIPGHAEARALLGYFLKKRGALEEAIGCFREAVRLKPDFVEVHSYLGETLAGAGRHEEAVGAYERALALKPDYADALNNYGISLRMVGRIDDAAEAFRRAAAGNFTPAWSNLGVVLDLKGERDEALAAYRHAVEGDPTNVACHNNLLYALHFHPDMGARELLAEHQKWDRQMALPLRQGLAPHRNTREPERRLKVGYVSPDFRGHPVGRFMLPLIRAHDRGAVEVYCYAQVQRVDRITEEIAGACRQWRVINGKSDAEVAEMIREDGIDILVDLTMHMSGSRILVFARKPAPVQATYLAYVSTTGLGTMDYRITDPYLDPPESDTSIYSERSVRVPRYWCYEPVAEAPAVNALPAAGGGGVTFGCLNGFNKVSDEALETWGRLLLKVPGARLLLHANPGNHRERVWRMLEAMGVARQRCEFVGLGRIEQYMATYHRIDIGLDPFPYAGGTTTCDALWMGVPVATLRGQRAIGRGGVSILSSLGPGPGPEWIADTRERYVEIAAELAGDLGRLAELRRSLRERMRQSPLMDAQAFARSIEGAYRQMWREYCGRSA